MTAAVEAFEVGLHALTAAREKAGDGARTELERARQAFTLAVKRDPTMTDGWMGLIAAGDTSARTLFQASRHAENLFVHSRAAGLPDGALEGWFDLGVFGLRHPVRFPSEVSVALACSLAYPGGGDSPQWAEAAEQLQGHLVAGKERSHGYQLALTALTGMWLNTEQWTRVTDTEPRLTVTWEQPLLAAAMSTMIAQAFANLGALDEASRRLHALLDDPQEAAQNFRGHVRLTLALVLREQGEEERAQRIISEIAATDATGQVAAYRSSTQRLQRTTAAALTTRTDPWDPGSGHDPQVAADREESAQLREEWLQEASATLAQQIGMAAVKRQVEKLRATVQMSRKREKAGLATDSSSRHLVFIGPPGTGKTTIARVVAKIFAGLGVVDSPKVVEASRRDFVGEHLGHTAPKTNAVIDSALGGVLFIDEVYTLIQEGLSGGDAFGREAVDTLLARMENDRDRLVVIVAGYEDEVDRFLASNDGLSSRFSRHIRFTSYTPDELVDIADVIAARRDSRLASGAREELHATCVRLGDGHRDGKTLIDIAGNGRFMRNVVEAAEEERDFRLAQDHPDLAEDGDPGELRETLMTITKTDMSETVANLLADLRIFR
ncbi:type VII secretion AAA-ATPase EccA [Aldersonia sp. NBC_00410]|uniref:type VII secretion AAA-ATPase EccA n=1 Tax=Aldersonia sp. NBC_00410 TaxID=2975954 RepID=UPI002251B377|nr:type VII secretion AAA-ATPase EccA [Aldersonia sp. NBC_00410]MCX5046289.1 type VII secretion AAA-ATPase EccA [Aldersonia sp. NBC_00410]